MRRTSLLILLATTVLAIAACSETTAPTPHAPGARSNDYTCLTGYQSSSGFVCTDSEPT